MPVIAETIESVMEKIENVSDQFTQYENSNPRKVFTLKAKEMNAIARVTKMLLKKVSWFIAFVVHLTCLSR